MGGKEKHLCPASLRKLLDKGWTVLDGAQARAIQSAAHRLTPRCKHNGMAERGRETTELWACGTNEAWSH